MEDAAELALVGEAQVAPVVELDRRRIGGGSVGPFTRRLQAAYFAAVRGDDDRYRDWAVPVY